MSQAKQNKEQGPQQGNRAPGLAGKLVNAFRSGNRTVRTDARADVQSRKGYSHIGAASRKPAMMRAAAQRRGSRAGRGGFGGRIGRALGISR